MNLKDARSAIGAILASIDDAEMPTPTRSEESEGITVVWFGGLGYHLGSAKRGGVRAPENYHRQAVDAAIEHEAVFRLDRKHLATEGAA